MEAEPTITTTAPRQFAEITIAELDEVLTVAEESLNPEQDESRWMQVLDAVEELKRTRVNERIAWDDKLEAISQTLSTLKSTHPRASWKTPAAHSQQLAQHGQRTLELNKQIAKLEAAISRAEADVRDCREDLRALGGVDGDDVAGDEEEELGRNSLALTMFRQLGFQPLISDGGGDGNAHTTSTILARSDAKGRVTPFKLDDAGDAAHRAQVANAMWDAVA